MRSSLSESLTGAMEAYSYIDEPRSGLMNMAIDDAMLDIAGERRIIVLRLYQWSEPTLSLGYFQRLIDRETHPSSSGLPMVRRATGGGAIIHHHDLTYSLAVPQSSSHVGAAPAIYSAVHDVFVAWFGELGLGARQWRETYNLQTTGTSESVSSKSEFLCFHRRSEGDVVVGNDKLVGSAQRRNKGALLQHGSLLIAKSSYAPSLRGLQELLPNEGKKTPPDRLFMAELCQRIERGIDALFGVSVQCDSQLARQMQVLAFPKMGQFAGSEWSCRA